MDTAERALKFPDPFNPYNFMTDGVNDCPSSENFDRLASIYRLIDETEAVTPLQKLFKDAIDELDVVGSLFDNDKKPEFYVLLPYEKQELAAKVRGIANRFGYKYVTEQFFVDDNPTQGSVIMFEASKQCRKNKLYVDFVRQVNALLTNDPYLSAMGENTVNWLTANGISL